MRLPLQTRSTFLDAEPAEGHVRFRIHGAYELADLEAIIPAMLAEVGRHGHSRAFIDITAMTGEFPDFDRYTLAQAFAQVWGSNRRAVILVDLKMQRVNKLFENVAVNRSAQVRVGDRAEELLLWLMEE